MLRGAGGLPVRGRLLLLLLLLLPVVSQQIQLRVSLHGTAGV